MNKRPFPSLLSAPHWGALKIAGIYLILGSLWILFSNWFAERVAINQEMLATTSLYKGLGYVLVTALLLYWMIRRHIIRLRASEMQLQQVLDALPALISYVDKDQRYRFTNSAYQDWFEGETIGKHIQEVVGTSVYESARKYVEKVLHGETVHYETEMPLPRGERFVSATYVPDIGTSGQVEGFFTLVQDVTEQKKILEEQRQWADAFEGCAHGIAIADPNTHRIVVCNPAFAKLHKSRVEEIVGLPILSLYAPSEHESVRRNVQKADQIGHAHFETRMTRRGKDGSTFPVEMDVVSVLGDDGELIHRVITAQDISERQAMDEKLKGSEAKYRTLVEHLPAITYISEPDQYVGVTYISPQIESLGFDIATWLADPELWLRHIHPDDLEQLQKELQDYQEGAETFRAEYRLILPTGESKWFHDESIRVKDEEGRTILKQGFMLDISDRKQAEQVLRESEERYRIVSELVSDYAYKDRVEEDGNISPEWVTESFTRITGYTMEEASAPGFWQRFVHPEDMRILQEQTQMVLSGQPHVMEIRVLTKRGEVCWLRDYSNPIWDPDQQRVVALYGAVKDITESKRAEEELRKSEERYHHLFENNPHPMWIYDRKTLAFLDVNEAAIVKYGYSREEFLDMTIIEIRPPEEIEKLMNNLVQPRQPLEHSEGWRHRLKDGTLIDVEISSHTIEIDGHESALVVAQDVTERKRVEDALRESEQKFSIIYYKAPFAAALSRLPDGVIIDVNEAFERVFGYTKEEVAGKTSLELGINPDSETRAHITAELQARGSVHDVELTLGTKSGGTRVFLMNIDLVGIGEQKYVFQTAQDITERKHAETALRESITQFRTLFEASPDAILLIDPHDNWPILDCNTAAGEMNGYTRTELIGQPIDILNPNPYDPVERKEYLAKIRREGILRYETPHRRKDGAEFPIEVSTTMISLNGRDVLLGIDRDITERKQIEKESQEAHAELEDKVQERTAALSEANALLQALMDNIPDHIYFKDRQCRFIRNSRSQATLLGLHDPSEAVGKTDFDFFPHAAQSYADEQEVMRVGKPHVDFEEWVVWPDGREMWVSTTKMPLRNSDGETIGIFGISRDITERKRTEQAIRQLNADLEKQTEQLQAANKELEAFSYSVSHDLRAPLRAIDGYTRILVEDYEPLLDSEGKRICGVISGEARRMGQLIDDLLAFSRLGRKELYSSKIDLKGLVVSVLNELLKDENQERMDIHIGKLPNVKGDASLIRQVWVNLLANAIKFTSKKERAVIEVGGKTTKNELIYYVRDNGAGFDMEYANKLFGVFQRLHSESEFSGTGVGLAIVQRIIRRHEGRVWAEGEVEKGATFYFALPRKESSHE
jgi:PAS domain S-box-containing protein